MDNFKNKVVRGYRLDIEIGSGGFGTVWHAYQEILEREVAVKVIKDKYVNNPQFVRQFEAEARIIARLEHFNIVTLYDYWRDPSGAYLVMRWLRGGSLRKFLKTGALDIAQTVRVINQTAMALSFAHQHNVIHRDIKPENILLDLEGNAFLTDFGIAIDLRNQDNVNMENISFGSPDYVAPEQLKDKVITPRSDIYSLGIMLYELLAGERPFVSKDPKEIMKMQLYNPVPSLRLKRPDLPPEIDTVIWQSTAKNPSHRYDNVLELAVAFQNIARKMDAVPSHYMISTQTHNRIAPDAKPAKSAENMQTENMAIDESHTTNLDEMPSSSDTNVLPQYTDDALDLERTADTLPDMLQTDALLSEDELDDERVLDTMVLDDGEQDDEALNTARLFDEDEIVVDDALVQLSTPEPDKGQDALNTAILDEGDEDLGTVNLFKSDQGGDIADDDPFGDSYSDAVGAATNRFEDYRNLVTMTIEGEGPPNPYKGLRAFEEADAGSFFGREEIVANLVTDFGTNTARFLALIGPSGSGKSSIVRAGMIPALRRGNIPGSDNWFFSTMVPRDNPFRELREAILRVAIIAPDNWGDVLEQDVRGLHKLLNLILPDDGSDLLLFIDQFEEVFTLGEDQEQREFFLSSLWYALNQPDSRLRLIITLRADFYDRPLHYPQFGQMLQENTQVVLPLSLEELESAIVGPAMRVGLLVEPGLKSAILNDVFNQPGALPLLQYALTELYDRKPPESQILSLDHYQKIGGIEGALAQRAQEVFIGLSPEEQTFARQLFLRLIAIDENGIVTRRRASWTDMKQGVDDLDTLSNVLDAYSKYRLLTRDLDQVTRAPTVEVAHEALIKGWDRLNQWIEQNRAALQRRQELRVEVDRWLANGRDKSYLATGSRLIEFESLLDNDLLSLRDTERDYITDSIALRNAIAERNRRINLVLRVFSVVTLVLLIGALAALYVANQQRSEAVEQAELAQSRELAASVIANQNQTDLAMLLAVEAVSITDTYDTRNAMLRALQNNVLVQKFFHNHEGGLRAVDFDTTGDIAISAGFNGNDNTILRWDMTTQTVIGEPLIGHISWINDLQISPDNRLIASAGNDGTVRLWDIETGTELAVLERHVGTVRTIDFSLDSQRLASAGDDGQIIIWDVDAHVIDQTLEMPLVDDQPIITYDLEFNSTATQLISGHDDNIIRVWELDSGEVVQELGNHENWVRSLRYDPTETAIIAGDANGILYFWSVELGELLVNPINTNQGGINALSLTTDGVFLATAGEDNTITIWSLSGQFRRIARMTAHSNRIWDIEFSPVDYRFLSASEDGDMLLSVLTAVGRPGRALLPTSVQISEFDYAAASEQIVVAGGVDGIPGDAVQVYESAENNLLYEFNLQDVSQVTDDAALVVTDLDVSVDGRLGAISLATGEVAVWDLATSEILWIDDQHETIAKEIEFTPDSTRLISAEESGSVIIWDATTGETIVTSITGEQESGVTAMAVSPDGQYLAIGGRVDLLVWDLNSETLILSGLNAHEDAITYLLFDEASETFFAASRDTNVYRWSMDGALRQVFEGNSDWVLSLALNTADDLLVTSNRTGSVRLFEMSSGRPLGNPLQGPDGWLTNIHYTDEHTLIGSNREEGILLSWTTDIEDWVTLACDISNRNLSSTEQAQFIRTDDYTPGCEALSP